MKTTKLFSVLFVLLTILMAGCSKDDDPSNPDTPVPDPEGTVTVKMRNDGSSAGSWGNVAINERNNFKNTWGTKLVDIGEVRGLGNVVDIPNAGWADEVSVQVGHGYFSKEVFNKDTTFYRIYVVDFLTDVSNSIIGAEVKYHKYLVKEAEPIKLDLSKESASYSIKGVTDDIYISTNASEWNYNCTDTSWFKIERIETGLRIIVPDNNTIIKHESTIYVTAEDIEKTIQLTQGRVESTSEPYAIGDLYCKDGVVGIVYKVTDEGRHGMIVSLDYTVCEWNTTAYSYFCKDESNGVNNLNLVKQQTHWETRYPAFKWCEDLNMNVGFGWYLPSIEELKELYAGGNGLSIYPGKENDAFLVYKVARELFDKALEENGGKPLFGNPYSSSNTTCFSSTQYQGENPTYYYAQCLGMQNGDWTYVFVNVNKAVRAIRAF